MDTSLDLVSKIDRIYSDATRNILMIVSFIVVFSGIITPILVALYQRKLHRLEEATAQQKIQEATRAALAELKTQFAAYRKESEARVSEALEELRDANERQSAIAFGATLHMQGNHQLRDKKYCACAVSYLEASGKYLRGGDYDNLITVLREIETSVLPKLNRTDFDGERIEERFHGLVHALESNNEKNVFRQWIDDFHRGVPAAMRREPVRNETANA